MAARRLLIVMLVLLGLSTLAAALVPPQATRDGTGTTVTEETRSVPDDTVPRGRLLMAKVAVGSKEELVPISVGDQLSLTVTSRKADQVEVPAYGLVEPVAPAKPAHFDLFAEAPGSYGVRLVNADSLVARIEVSKPETGKKGARSRARGESGPG